jgi:hypothetical protein
MDRKKSQTNGLNRIAKIGEYRRGNKKVNNLDKLANKNKTKTQHNMCWTPPYFLFKVTVPKSYYY